MIGHRGHKRETWETGGAVETGLTVLKHYLTGDTGNMGNTGETGVTFF